MSEPFYESLEKPGTLEQRTDELNALVKRLVDESGIAHRDRSELDGNERMLLEAGCGIEYLLDQLAETRQVLLEVREADDAIINCEATTKAVFERTALANARADELLGRKVGFDDA